jgi:hypothetical protein
MNTSQAEPDGMQKDDAASPKIQWSAGLGQQDTTPKDARKVRPARPPRVKDRGGTYQASLEPLASIICERRITLPPGILDRYVEGLNDARTLFGEKRVSARWDRAGEKSDFFSILGKTKWGWVIDHHIPTC